MIRLKELGDFNRAEAKLPQGNSFTKTCSDYDINCFFLESCETRKEVLELFDQELKYPSPFQTLYKVDSPGRYLINLFIRGIKFKDALCNSGLCINVIYVDIAKKIGIKELKPSNILIKLADSSFITPKGMISDIYMSRNCINVPADFHIVEIHWKEFSDLILRRSFPA